MKGNLSFNFDYIPFFQSPVLVNILYSIGSHCSSTYTSSSLQRFNEFFRQVSSDFVVHPFGAICVCLDLLENHVRTLTILAPL